MTGTNVAEKSSFQLRADFFPVTVMRLTSPDLDSIRVQLEKTIAQAPKYLIHAPIIVDAFALGDKANALKIPELCQLMRSKKIIPVGIRGLPENLRETVEANHLAFIRFRQSSDSLLSLSTNNVKPKKELKQQPTPGKTMVVTKPVRAGTQLYAKGGDLIVLAAVNAGAECIADGNIHVYGPLRGRALAGAKGDTTARIFCESLEGELVAVAGHYLVNEKISAPKTNRPMIQVYLEGETVKVAGI